MKKILVPIDFSDYSMNAAHYAAEIAKKFDSTIYFLHVATIPSYDGNLPFQEQQNIAEGLFILKHIRNKFKQLFEQDFLKGIKVVEAIQFDGVYESITDQAEKNEIDLIVMGTHGSSGAVSDYFIGSHTDKIVRRAVMPVISVREKVEKVAFDRIVFASDFEDDVSKSFQFIKKFAENFNSKIELLRIVTKGDFLTSMECVQIMQSFAQAERLTNYSCHVHNAHDVQSGINEYAVISDTNLITTATNGRKGLALLLNGSVTRDLMKKASVPVLTVKI
jgi:nucleotide-binding universal stress UspA family protein